jgi:mannose-1-phosphate guanylyltransferase/phosphomannomutase
MRKLTEDAQGYSHAELLDGIKVYDGDAWVLILPDEAEPIFHIRAEGENLKESKELIRGSVCKIQSMIENAA